MSKIPLGFKPDDLEEDYINRRLRELKIGWSDYVRFLLKLDRGFTRRELVEKIQGSLILLFVGIMAFLLGSILPSINSYYLSIVVVLFLVAFFAVTYSAFSIIAELYNYVRRRNN